ncbi:hypothetical protein [Hydrogenophaga sp.]|uniref:hypothetical protein n=1 Tax=Hydrogenophaga sp. TaxID=1904254 RepID=UPI003F728348
MIYLAPPCNFSARFNLPQKRSRGTWLDIVTTTVVPITYQYQEEAMKALSIILNVFFPGVGSLVIGKVGQGITQIILYFIGVLFCFTLVGAIVGIPLMIGVWIWGLVTVTSAPALPVEVVVVHRNESKET